MLLTKSKSRFYAPKYSDNSIGVPKWSELHEDDFDVELMDSLYNFIHYEARRKGFNDSGNNRVVENGQNMFHAEFLGGLPHNLWNQRYRAGVEEHKKDFRAFSIKVLQGHEE